MPISDLAASCLFSPFQKRHGCWSTSESGQRFEMARACEMSSEETWNTDVFCAEQNRVLMGLPKVQAALPVPL